MSARATAPEGTRSLSTKDADEELARLFLASVLDVPVTVHDRRSGHSTYDLDIQYRDGRRGAAEVVSTRTQVQAAQLSAVRRAGYTKDRQLTHAWVVRVLPDAVISRVLPGLPAFLAELERSGMTELNRNRFYGLEMHQRLRSLHVSSCLAYPPPAGRPPGFYVYPEASGAWVGDGEEIRQFCEEFLWHPAQADVLKKLNGSGADERHAVVITTRPARAPHSRGPAPDAQPGSRPGQPHRLAVGHRLPGPASPRLLLDTPARLAHRSARQLTPSAGPSQLRPRQGRAVT